MKQRGGQAMLSILQNSIVLMPIASVIKITEDENEKGSDENEIYRN
jgi:hypothetical protein